VADGVNSEKCEVIHFGRANLNAEYRVNGRILGSVEEQREFGVHIHRSLKVATQVDRVVKGYGVLAFISRGIAFKSHVVMLQLYKTLVWPRMEYCVQFWSPRSRKDVEALERVQRRFTRMLPGMEGRSYEERLRELGLFSLERRRMRADLIEVYKMIRGIDRVYSQRLFPLVEVAITRGHNFKVSGGRYRGDAEMPTSIFCRILYDFCNKIRQHDFYAANTSFLNPELRTFFGQTRRYCACVRAAFGRMRSAAPLMGRCQVSTAHACVKAWRLPSAEQHCACSMTARTHVQCCSADGRCQVPTAHAQ